MIVNYSIQCITAVTIWDSLASVVSHQAYTQLECWINNHNEEPFQSYQDGWLCCISCNLRMPLSRAYQLTAYIQYLSNASTTVWCGHAMVKYNKTGNAQIWRMWPLINQSLTSPIFSSCDAICCLVSPIMSHTRSMYFCILINANYCPGILPLSLFTLTELIFK